MKGFREIMKAFNNSAMKLVYTLGYLLVPKPRSPDYQLSLNDPWFPLRVVGLTIVSLIIVVILAISTIIAILSIPFLFNFQHNYPD